MIKEISQDSTGSTSSDSELMKVLQDETIYARNKL